MKPSRKTIAFLLITIGIGIIIYPHVAQSLHSTVQKKQSDTFREKVKSFEPEIITQQVNTAKQCNEAMFKNEDNVHDPFTIDYNRDAYEGCEKAPIIGNQFAALELPKLNLEIPIYLGTTETILAKGIGQVDGSSLPIGGASTHTVLAGHRGMGTKAMFRNLDEYEVGDMFYLHTLAGKSEYEVYEVEVILPHETNNLLIEEDRDLASLITCHPYRANSHRLVIHGERVK